jgi:Skp family chaperone for outer membrane proteins
MKGNYVPILLIILLALTCLGMGYYLNMKMNKIVVIDVIRTLNEYEFKKDLETDAQGNLLVLRNKLDSLGGIIELSNSRQQMLPKTLVEEYQFWQMKANEAYEVSNNSINEKVWKRLNPLIDEFGAKNNIRIMIGANGMGTVLYNNDAVSMTDELITYINKNYKTGAK